MLKHNLLNRQNRQILEKLGGQSLAGDLSYAEAQAVSGRLRSSAVSAATATIAVPLSFSERSTRVTGRARYLDQPWSDRR